MNPEHSSIDERQYFLDLLVDRELEGLSNAECIELDQLLSGLPEQRGERDATSIGLAAAAAELAFLPPAIDALPATLAGRIKDQAVHHFDQTIEPRILPRPLPGRPRVGPLIRTWGGWLTAAAALVVMAAWPWIRPSPIPVTVLLKPEEPRSLSPPPLTLAEQMNNLLASVPPVSLKATEHPLATGAGGELVWDSEHQKGYMRILGLAEVRPARGVYQLWMFDKKRDSRYPVSGGSFTIDDSRRPTVVPIKAELDVREPLQFAITLEPPGGVVVSDRQRVMLVAQTGP